MVIPGEVLSGAGDTAEVRSVMVEVAAFPVVAATLVEAVLPETGDKRIGRFREKI